MIFEVSWVIAIIFMVILSVIDIKTFHLKDGFIPAVLTTGFLIVAFLFNLPMSLITGVLGFLIGMLLVDLDLFHGVADWKVFVACSFVLPTIMNVAVFGLLTSAVASVYQVLTKRIGFKEIPFIPAILIAFLGTLGVMLL